VDETEQAGVEQYVEAVHTIDPLDAYPNKPKPAPPSEPIPCNAAGKRICGAMSAGGRTCQSTILFPNGRCKMHGGPSVRGAAHPNFKHGRYSKAMPKGLKDAYNRAEADPDLLSLRADVALLQALAENALAAMAGEFPPWEEGAELIRQLGPLKTGEPLDGDRQQVLSDLRDLLEAGADKAHAWERGRRELKDCIDRKTHVASAEHKRLHDQSLALPVEQAMAFIGALIEAARAVVKPRDEQMYRELMMETARLLPSRPQQEVVVEKPTVPVEVESGNPG